MLSGLGFYTQPDYQPGRRVEERPFRSFRVSKDSPLLHSFSGAYKRAVPHIQTKDQPKREDNMGSRKPGFRFRKEVEEISDDGEGRHGGRGAKELHSHFP